MVGAILAVAQNKISRKEFYEMITIPSEKSWPARVVVPSSAGLYLCNVEYSSNEIQEAIDEKYQELVNNFGENEFFERITRTKV